MIISDTSFLPLPGKEAEAVSAFKEIAAHFDTRWPLTVPRQVLVDLTGETGRIHLISMKESLAEHERQVAEQGVDEAVRALAQKVTPLGVPGSRRAGVTNSGG
jgi:hypothetical protein